MYTLSLLTTERVPVTYATGTLKYAPPLSWVCVPVIWKKAKLFGSATSVNLIVPLIEDVESSIV
jgi:hypothetical protein